MSIYDRETIIPFIISELSHDGLGQKNNKSEIFELLKGKEGYESTLPHLTN